MKRTKNIFKHFAICALALVMVCALPLFTTAGATGIKWANPPRYIYFRNELGTKWTSSIQRAMNTWNAVKTTSGEMMIHLGLTSNSNEKNVIRSGDLTLGSNHLAVMRPTTNGLNSFVSVEIVIDLGNNYITDGANSMSVDMESLILHELGHALGIGHCHSGNEICRYGSGNVMDPTLAKNTKRRTLREYDKSTYRSIYS